MGIPFRKLIPDSLEAYLPAEAPRRPRDRWRRLRALWYRLFPQREERALPEAPATGQRSWLAQALFPRKLTEAEKKEQAAERAKLREQRAREYAIYKQAREFLRVTQRTLLNKGVVYERQSEKKKIVNQVKFMSPPNINDEMVEWRIDTAHLPRGIDLAVLKDEALLDLISANCGFRVRFKYRVGFGAWYVYDLQEDAGGVPAHVTLQEMDGTRPAYLDKDRLAIPFGLGEGRRAVWRNLKDCVHLLIAGATDHGKSNLLNVILCTLAAHNTPDQLRFVMFDLKGGMELQDYWTLPHLLTLPRITLKRRRRKIEADMEDESDAPPDLELALPEVPEAQDRYRKEYQITGEYSTPILRVVQEASDVPGALYWLIREAERRMELFKKCGARKLSEYNQKNPNNRLNVIVVPIDEWADVKLTRGIGDLSEEMLANLSNRGRAVGIHLIVCTQTPNSEVLTQRIRAALVTRIVFRIVDPYMSIALVNSHKATEITRQGRALFVNGAFQELIQCPRITGAMVNEMIEAAKGARADTPALKRGHDVSDMEILEWAVRFNEGRLASTEIYQHFKERKLPKRATEDFGPRLVGQRIEIAGTLYQVYEGRRGFPPIPYRLLAVEAETAEMIA